MEGIAGIIYPDVFQTTALIDPMLDSMRHRGNGKREALTIRNFQIGTVGGSLAANEKKNIHAAVSGRIRNWPEVHKQLKRSGHSISSSASYGELVIQAYEQWDVECIAHLSGDFALLIFDEHQERILLARDRIGQKPLYWHHDRRYFIFGSEMKALMSTGIIPQTPSQNAFAAYLYLGYMPQDMTPIKEVNKLLPGHYLLFNKNQSISINQYWSYSSYFEKNKVVDESIIVRELDNRLRSSTLALLPKPPTKEGIPKEPIGCFISGGLGSAAIAYYLKLLRQDTPLTGYSIGFKEQNDDDIKAANEIASILGINHRIDYISADNLTNNLVKTVWYLEEPLADPHIVAAWKLAEISSPFTKKVFSGMGSDETLAGHSRYTQQEQHVNMFRSSFQTAGYSFLRLLIPILRCLYLPGAFQLLKHTRTPLWQTDYLKKNALFDHDHLVLAAPSLSGLFNPEIFLQKFHNLSRIKSRVSSFLYFDVKTRLVDCFILQMERLTAAHNQEWSAPFLDRGLVEFLAMLPEPDYLCEQDQALFLKSLLKDVYSSNVVYRPKRTRREFLNDWVLDSSLGALFQMLPNGMLAESGIISRVWLRAQTATPHTRYIAFRYLWSVLILEIWFRLYISNPMRLGPPEISAHELLAQS